ncbi:hypothetical protein HPB47_025992 [Ixodes persulcatus]|uniref:Uncharacterized protein n=1 Tax=Ixodes persulcatus TaxID=34615 RepID=A0AC60Q004_IXOPE|nr:hypothetical protein HPB47_025992 [Ixodes persulcatus]
MDWAAVVLTRAPQHVHLLSTGVKASWELECHFLRQACCENLTCIRYTASSPMTGICHLDVHTGNEYSVPSIATRKPEPKPVLPPVEHFVPPSGPPRNPLVLKENPECCPC